MGHVFRIVELVTGGGPVAHGVASGASVPQRFEWRGKAIPREALEWGVEQRTAREDYGDQPVEHLMGSGFDGPMDFTGVWDDRDMGAGVAMDTMFALEAMVARGTRVEVSFGRLQWVGVLLKVRPRYQRDSRIGYVITISPHSRERDQTLNTARADMRALARRSPGEFTTSASSAAEDLGIVQDDAPRAVMAGDDLNEIAGLVFEAQVAAERARTAVHGITLAGDNEQAEAYLRAANAFGQLRASCVLVTDRATDSDLFGVWNWGSALGQLQVAAWAGETTLGAFEMAGESDAAYRELCRRGRPKSRAPYEVTQRESLYAISYRFYGTTERANDIAAANSLPGLMAEAGARLIIPEVV
jgi:hypothetical protein